MKDRQIAFYPFFVKTLYIISAVLLFFYSFTQIDLSLTLSRVSTWQTIQKFFQYIGYFNRPLSTSFFIVISLLLFFAYILFLQLVRKGKITKKDTWLTIIFISVILFFSYNAFSYDLFNYIFDAKIVTFYQNNPYMHKALDFSADPMLSFMRWTHRTYPYGPAWLLLTVPLSFIGLQFFLPTLLLFKALMALSFLGTVFFIGKILGKISPKHEILGMVFFGLQPLVIIESLVSAHNDIVMMFFAVASLYAILQKRYFLASLFFVFSVGIKFSTVFLLPLFVLIIFLRIKKRTLSWEILSFIGILLMIFPMISSSVRTEMQPWYFLWILPFMALLAKKGWIVVSSSIFSLALLSLYVPFLYTGNWDAPFPVIKMWILISSLGFVFFVFLIAIFRRKLL